jgi:hypothetical protein
MLKQTIYITRPDMVSVLMNVENPTFVNLVTKTKVRMNKKGNPFHDMVTKCLTSNFYIGSNYENRVNNNRVKEGIENDFVSSPLSGKRHISKCILTNTNQENGVKFYLMCEWFKRSYPKISYEFEGNSIERELFKSYEVKRKESEKQEVENKVNIVTYGMESVQEIRMNKVRYIMID